MKSSDGYYTIWRWSKWLKQPKPWWRLWATPKPHLRVPLTWTTSGQCSKWVAWEVRTQLSLILELTSQKLTSEFMMVERLGRGKGQAWVCLSGQQLKQVLPRSPVMMLGLRQHGLCHQNVWFKPCFCHFVALWPWWGYSASVCWSSVKWRQMQSATGLPGGLNELIIIQA